jgi:transcriptional regulator with XRE-family HTH domain
MAKRAINGATVRALRDALGMRQDDMAAQLEISGSYLANIEAGRKQPRATVQRRIADLLGVPLVAITYPVTADAGQDREVA